MKKRKKVLLGPSIFASTNKMPLEKLQAAGFEVLDNPYKRKLTQDELLNLLPEVSGLIAGLEKLDRFVLEKSELKVISRCGSGTSNVDLSAAAELGIKVFNTPDAPVESVAELTIGALICLVRFVAQMNNSCHEGKWEKKIGLELKQSTVGIIGFGKIGRRLAQLLEPFGARIIAADPFLKKAAGKVEIMPLEQLLTKANIISLHASGEDAIIGKKEFSLMKNGVFLLNCARGGLIDEAQLIQALDSGKIAGAWLDCFPEEPYKGKLTLYPQVILTPHIGSYTKDCRNRMEMEAVDNLLSGFNAL